MKKLLAFAVIGVLLTAAYSADAAQYHSKDPKLMGEELREKITSMAKNVATNAQIITETENTAAIGEGEAGQQDVVQQWVGIIKEYTDQVIPVMNENHNEKGISTDGAMDGSPAEARGKKEALKKQYIDKVEQMMYHHSNQYAISVLTQFRIIRGDELTKANKRWGIVASVNAAKAGEASQRTKKLQELAEEGENQREKVVAEIAAELEKLFYNLRDYAGEIQELEHFAASVVSNLDVNEGYRNN